MKRWAFVTTVLLLGLGFMWAFYGAGQDAAPPATSPPITQPKTDPAAPKDTEETTKNTIS